MSYRTRKREILQDKVIMDGGIQPKGRAEKSDLYEASLVVVRACDQYMRLMGWAMAPFIPLQLEDPSDTGSGGGAPVMGRRTILYAGLASVKGTCRVVFDHVIQKACGGACLGPLFSRHTSYFQIDTTRLTFT